MGVTCAPMAAEQADEIAAHTRCLQLGVTLFASAEKTIFATEICRQLAGEIWSPRPEEAAYPVFTDDRWT